MIYTHLEPLRCIAKTPNVMHCYHNSTRNAVAIYTRKRWNTRMARANTSGANLCRLHRVAFECIVWRANYFGSRRNLTRVPPHTPRISIRRLCSGIPRCSTSEPYRYIIPCAGVVTGVLRRDTRYYRYHDIIRGS